MKIPKARQLPSGMWTIRVRVSGVDDSRTFETEKDAIRWATLRKAEALAGRGTVTAEHMTIRDMMEAYVQESVLAPKTVDTYRACMRKHFQQIMDRPYDSIRNWQRVVNLELQQYSANNVSLCLKKIFTALRYHGLPVPAVRIQTTPSKRKEYLEPKEIRRFCQVIRGHRHEFYFLMMLSSCRVSEALAIEPEDITEKGVHVRGTKTPASDRFIPWMIPRLQELDLPRKTSYHTLKRDLADICEHNDFPPMTCHSLRISFASLMYSKQVPERVAMKIGGWTSTRVFHDVYVRIAEDDVNYYAEAVRNVFS